MANRCPAVVGACGLALVALCLAVPARISGAAEIVVLSVGAVEVALRESCGRFERRTGLHVRTSYAPVATLRQRVAAGERWDVLVAPLPVLAELQSTSASTPVVALGRVGLSAAVHARTPLRAIDTVDVFRQALTAADEIAISRGTSGQHLETVFDALGMTSALSPKVTRHADGHAVFRRVLESPRHVIGFGQPTEMKPYADQGLREAGALPGSLQQYVSYGAIANPTGDAPAAASLLTFLDSRASRSVFERAGVTQ